MRTFISVLAQLPNSINFLLFNSSKHCLSALQMPCPSTKNSTVCKLFWEPKPLVLVSWCVWVFSPPSTCLKIETLWFPHRTASQSSLSMSRFPNNIHAFTDAFITVHTPGRWSTSDQKTGLLPSWVAILTCFRCTWLVLVINQNLLLLKTNTQEPKVTKRTPNRTHLWDVTKEKPNQFLSTVSHDFNITL